MKSGDNVKQWSLAGIIPDLQSCFSATKTVPNPILLLLLESILTVVKSKLQNPLRVMFQLYALFKVIYLSSYNTGLHKELKVHNSFMLHKHRTNQLFRL